MNTEKDIGFLEDDEFKGLGDGLLKNVQEKPVKKGPRVKKTLKQKALRVMLKRSGLQKPPLIESILEGKTGIKIPISEIGFISNDKQKDKLLSELAQECQVRNRLNRDEISKNRMLVVGTDIFRAKHMWTPIYVSKDIHDGRYECISGRHRLAFLSIVYGSQTEIPVHVEYMTLKSAREATAVANDGRPVKAMERASYAILRAVGGDSAADQEKLYECLSNLKSNIVKYCVYSVMERGYPCKLGHKLSERSSKPCGELTTVSNVEVFWGEALPWVKGVKREAFDEMLSESVKFLNEFISKIVMVDGFDADQHLSSNVMWAVGRYYLTYKNITNRNPVVISREIAESVVGIGMTERKSQSDIYREISGRMSEK